MVKVATFCKYNMKKKIGSILLGVLLEMLKFGLFYPIALWGLPYNNSGMGYLRS
jgi:hypothetical protein